MSDASDSTLNTIKALVDAFKTGTAGSATPASTAEAAWVPPPFPVPAKDARQDALKDHGRLPSTKTLTEGNYARQRLEDLARGQSQQPDEKPVTDCAGSLHISLFFDGTCCNQEDADEVYGSPKPALTNVN